MSFKNLQIWQDARELVIEIHKMTLNNLPKFEMYEEGNQIRRSVKSIKSNIVEGYGRSRYKQEYIRFLIFAHASCDEAINQLEMINRLYFKDAPINNLIEKYNLLGSKINRFIQHVENNWNTT